MNVQRLLHAVMILFLAAMTFANQPAAAQPLPQGPVDALQDQPPNDLASLLQPDGRLKVPPGTSGSFDAAGWQMAMDEQGEPHFYPPPAPSAPQADNNFWSRDFLLGVEEINFESVSVVYALAVDGPNIYVGGIFNTAGDVAASNIARWSWTDKKWHPLGAGVSNAVGAIAVSATSVYVGGVFSSAGGNSTGPLARWDKAAETWSSMGALTRDSGSPRVSAIAVMANGDVVVGGQFTSIGGVAANHIARWNGAAWDALDGGVASPSSFTTEVCDIVTTGSRIYAGGYFTQAGTGTAVRNLAVWNSGWASVAGGVGGPFPTVRALGLDGDKLYVGGDFTQIFYTIGDDPIPVQGIAQWWVGNWSTLDGGMSGLTERVYAIAVTAEGVLAGGQFLTASGTTVNRVALWNGADWLPLVRSGGAGPGADNLVYALAGDATYAYLGGYFESAGGMLAHHVAAFNISSFIPTGLGNSLNGTVHALYVDGKYVYVGGAFTSAGGLSQELAARWDIDKRTWNFLDSDHSFTGCMGGGCNPMIRAFYFDGLDLYVGGSFIKVGNTTVNGIARYLDTSLTWSPMAGGVSCPVVSCSPVVWAITKYNGSIHIGGRFTHAGGNLVNNLAAWDGIGWDALVAPFSDPGTSGAVYTLGTHLVSVIPLVRNLVVGGSFTLPEPYIVQWNGSNFSSLGSGLNSVVYAIAGGDFGTPLYIGGSFTSAAPGPSYVAKLSSDHKTWLPLGGGLNGTVNALALNDQEYLFAGGEFTASANGLTPLSHVARWNGISWSALSTGTNNGVTSLAVSGSHLFAGGLFTVAGGYPSYFIASWNQQDLFVPLIRK